jgi:hypothetical protein
MLKHLKLVTTMSALAFAVVAASSAVGAPAGVSETAGGDFAGQFWTMPRMKAMDTNKDGMVSRDEYMTYMGAQYDMMDSGKKKMLDSKAFMDRKMMTKTFPVFTE